MHFLLINTNHRDLHGRVLSFSQISLIFHNRWSQAGASSNCCTYVNVTGIDNKSIFDFFLFCLQDIDHMVKTLKACTRTLFKLGFYLLVSQTVFFFFILSLSNALNGNKNKFKKE